MRSLAQAVFQRFTFTHTDLHQPAPVFKFALRTLQETRNIRAAAALLTRTSVEIKMLVMAIHNIAEPSAKIPFSMVVRIMLSL